MSRPIERMKFVNFNRPVLTEGRHNIQVTQKVTEPQSQTFTCAEDFYVTGRAYTIDINDIFSFAPNENECGDLSKLLPFITLENKNFPWEKRIMGDIGTTPVPWVALVVISSQEPSAEKDITIEELQNQIPPRTFYPDKSVLPPVVVEKDSDLCHIVDIPKELYHSIMPSFEDMTYLTHVRRVDLFYTEDNISAKDGDFSVVIANRFIPTGDKEPLKSTVHLVSMLGMTNEIPDSYDTVRLVSLHRWNVYSVRDNTETFQNLIDGLSKNKGMIGYDRDNEVLKRCYVPKKHMTRSGETTYSLYRSPLIPYANKDNNFSSKVTADGHLIYDPQKGIFDTSYAAAFQLGRLISLNHRTDSKALQAWRKGQRTDHHKILLRESINFIDVEELCKKMIKDMV
jgi:hypothetical protein